MKCIRQDSCWNSVLPNMCAFCTHNPNLKITDNFAGILDEEIDNNFIYDSYDGRNPIKILGGGEED